MYHSYIFYWSVRHLTTYLPTHLPTYPPTYPPTYLPNYPPTYDDVDVDDDDGEGDGTCQLTVKNEGENFWPCSLFVVTPSSVTTKNCQMSIKVAQNDLTRKMIDFDTFTKIA